MKARTDIRAAAWLWQGCVAALFLLYTLVRALPLASTAPFFTGDSPFYYDVANAPLSQMFSGIKPFVAPLFYRILGADLTAIMVGQTLVSIVCWSLLAFVVMLIVRPKWLKVAAALGVMGISLNLTIPYWDHVILSESLSFSLLALFLASCLWLLYDWKRYKELVVVIVALFWVGARDTNAYMLLALAACIVVFSLVTKQGKRTLMLVLAFTAIFAMSTLSATASARWLFPYLNIVVHRVLPDSEYSAYFQAHGMPVTPELTNLSGEWAASDNGALYYSPELAQFRNWVVASGRTTYVSYLVTHPVKTLTQPLPELSSLWTPPLTEVLLIVAPLCFIGSALLRRLRREDAMWLAPLVMLVTLYPHALAVWHGDAMDLDRHLLSVAIQLQLGLFLLLVLVAESWGSGRLIEPSGNPTTPLQLPRPESRND